MKLISAPPYRPTMLGKNLLAFYRRARYCHGKSSVCLSVTLRCRYHTCWNTSKIISQFGVFALSRPEHPGSTPKGIGPIQLCRQNTLHPAVSLRQHRQHCCCLYVSYRSQSSALYEWPWRWPLFRRLLRSCQPLRHIRRWISRTPLEIEAWLQRTTNRKWPTGNHMVTWWWRHVTPKGQTRDPNTLRARYLERV